MYEGMPRTSMYVCCSCKVIRQLVCYVHWGLLSGVLTNMLSQQVDVYLHCFTNAYVLSNNFTCTKCTSMFWKYSKCQVCQNNLRWMMSYHCMILFCPNFTSSKGGWGGKSKPFSKICTRPPKPKFCFHKSVNKFLQGKVLWMSWVWKSSSCKAKCFDVVLMDLFVSKGNLVKDVKREVPLKLRVEPSIDLHNQFPFTSCALKKEWAFIRCRFSLEQFQFDVYIYILYIYIHRVILTVAIASRGAAKFVDA